MTIPEEELLQPGDTVIIKRSALLALCPELNREHPDLFDDILKTEYVVEWTGAGFWIDECINGTVTKVYNYEVRLKGLPAQSYMALSLELVRRGPRPPKRTPRQ